MNDCFKCCLISMGIGLGIGLYVGATNKKIQSETKKAKEMATEKLNTAKEKISEITESLEEEQEQTNNKKQKKSSSKQ